MMLLLFLKLYHQLFYNDETFFLFSYITEKTTQQKYCNQQKGVSASAQYIDKSLNRYLEESDFLTTHTRSSYVMFGASVLVRFRAT